MVRVPPCFWAKAGGDAAKTRKNGPAAANPVRFRFTPRYLPWLSRARRVALVVTNPSETRGRPLVFGPIRLGSRDRCRRHEGYHVLPLRVHCLRVLPTAVGNQSVDREGARPHRSALAPRPRRRSDRMTLPTAAMAHLGRPMAGERMTASRPLRRSWW